MGDRLDLDQIFPIHGPEAAKLMTLKARCLLRAGLLTSSEMLIIAARARLMQDKAAPGDEKRRSSESAGLKCRMVRRTLPRS
jgi:hypothetical protein